jgi:hypothetical protein
MLRYPRFTQPDFGQTRRLVQDFRVTSEQLPQSLDEEQSRWNRKILFINGVAWLLRMFECEELGVNLGCVQPPIPSGHVGVPIMFTTLVDQNGSCTAGGVLLTNSLSPGLRAVSAEVVCWDGMLTNNYQVTVSSNLVVASFAQLPRNSFYELRTVAIPTRSGWLTNHCTVSRGLYQETPCAQIAFIEGPACTTARLSTRVDTNNTLHLVVHGGLGCTFQIESSSDLRNWVDLIQIQPDGDPYDVQIGPASDAFRFYRLRIVEGSACTTARLSAVADINNILHVVVRGGAGCTFQLESSVDLRNWVDFIQIQPNGDPYDVQSGPASAPFRFYRLRKL